MAVFASGFGVHIRSKMLFILSPMIAAWTLFENGVGNGRLPISSFTK
jgi:hypothetical protein